MATIEVVNIADSDSDVLVEQDLYSDNGSVQEIIQPKKKSKLRKRRNTPIHSNMAVLLAAQSVRVEDLIKETQNEVIRKLPKSSLLSKLSKDQIIELLEAFVLFTDQKADKLEVIKGAYSDYDKVTGGKVYHVERLIEDLKTASANVSNYVIAQLYKAKRCANFKGVNCCRDPTHWDTQLLLNSVISHLDNERKRLEHLLDSYIAVSRVPPVIPHANGDASHVSGEN